MSDSISVNVSVCVDSLQIDISTNNPKYQMSFLMQGLTVLLVNSLGKDTITIAFPNARMVRSKVHRHPNEVKAMLDENKKERRPDLQPLISVLNETPLHIFCKVNPALLLFPNIQLDKENENIIFCAKIPNISNLCVNDIITIILETSQFTQFNMPEFVGKRLSKEDKMPLGGLGLESEIHNDTNRNFRVIKTVTIQ